MSLLLPLEQITDSRPRLWRGYQMVVTICLDSKRLREGTWERLSMMFLRVEFAKDARPCG